MSDAPTASLEQLLSALTNEPSLRGKLRVLGRSWTLLRSLSPGQREQVALAVGTRWVWERVEKSFLKDGELSDSEQMLGQAFERLGDADPQELRSIARTIKQGDTRAARDLLLNSLSDALEEEASEGEEQAIGVAAHEEEDATAMPPESGPTQAAERVETAAAVLASSRARVTPPAEAGAPEPPAAPPAPEPPAPPPVATSAAQPVVHPTAPTHAVGTGADRLRILRALQRSEHPGAELGTRGRSELLESLGGGWATRRALSRMINARSLDGVDEALALIDRLGSPSQQTWCLADLLHHWDLEQTEIEQILDAAPSNAARRRLARRTRAA